MAIEILLLDCCDWGGIDSRDHICTFRDSRRLDADAPIKLFVTLRYGLEKQQCAMKWYSLIFFGMSLNACVTNQLQSRSACDRHHGFLDLSSQK